jgi:hypothetical protein
VVLAARRMYDVPIRLLGTRGASLTGEEARELRLF